MALPATDSFTNTSGDSWYLGDANFPSWTDLTGGSTLVVTAAGDQVFPNKSGATSLAYWNADSFSADHYSKLTITGAYGSNYGCIGPAVCVQSGAASGYAYLVGGDESSTQRAAVVKLTAGSVSVLGSWHAAPAISTVIKLERSGNDLKVYYDDVLQSGLTQTDSTYTTGAAGVAGRFQSTVYVGGDDWEGGNVTAATPEDVLLIPRRQLFVSRKIIQH